MSTSCTSSPTSTITRLVSSTTVSTTFSAETTTIPGTPSPIVTAFCASFATGASLSTTPTCANSTTSTIGTTTIGGGVTTTQVSGVTTIVNVSTQFSTLYGSSCTVISNPTTSTPAPTPTTMISTILIPTVTTPPPSTITSQLSITLADGAVTVQTVTSIKTLPPSSVNITSTISDLLTNETGGSTASFSSGTLGAIIGGTVGGALVLIALMTAVWCLIRRRRRRWDIFEKSDIATVTKSPRSKRGLFSLNDEGPRLQPYPYGLAETPSSPNTPFTPGSGMRKATVQGSGSLPAGLRPDDSSRSHPLSSGTMNIFADGHFNDPRLSSPAFDENNFQVVSGTNLDDSGAYMNHLHDAAIAEDSVGERRPEFSGKNTALRSSTGGKVRDSRVTVRQSSIGGFDAGLEVGTPRVTRSHSYGNDVSIHPPAYEE